MTQQNIKRSAQQPDATSQETKGILSQLSMPAILAAVLTSVTSFLLSSKLGLTGSLIGAAIAAAVSTTASQLYNAMIKSSMERIQDFTDDMVARSQGRQDTTAMPARDAAHDADSYYVPGGMRLAPNELRQEAAHRRAVQIARRSFAVALAAALVALLAYTAVVNVATQGQGIGPSIEEFSAPAAPTNTEAQQDPAAEGATNSSGTTTDAATGSTQDQAGTTDTVEQTDSAGAAGQTGATGTSGQTDGSDAAGGNASSSSGNGNASTSESAATGTVGSTDTNGIADAETAAASTDDLQGSAALQ